MAPLPRADPNWESHLTAAYKFEAPTDAANRRYPRKQWMTRARRLWQRFGTNDLDNRNDIARLIARAIAQEDALRPIEGNFGAGTQADDDPAVEEQNCIDAIDAFKRLISTYQEWRHASLHCKEYPEESARWLWHEFRDCRDTLDDHVYPRYRDVRKAIGALDRPNGPGPQARVPGFLERLKGVAMRVDKALLRSRQRNARRSKPNGLTGEHWLGGWELGLGGQGYVNLWIQLNDNHRITERRAVKDTYVKPYYWDSLWFWHGDVKNVKTRIPVDIQAMIRLRDDAKCDKIVHMDSWAPHWEHLMYRTYLPYYAYHDLEHLLREYLNEDQADESYVPEAFVWRVFEACVQAGLAMEKGAPDYDGGDWPSIVHRDLKPGNILLDETPCIDWPTYPTPKIGDFGYAVFTNKDDALNPDTYTGPGTSGYRAPEQTQLLDADSLELVARNERFLLSSKTNVWATGKTILELMNLYDSTRAAHDNQPDYTLGDREPEIAEAALWYSKKLRRMVQVCVRYEPNRRPTFQQLLQRIRHYTAYNASEHDTEDDTDDDVGHNPDSMDWGDSSDDDDGGGPDDLADGMRDFDPNGGVEDPHPLLHMETRLGRSFPLNRTIVAGGGGLPTPGMGWPLPEDGSTSELSEAESNPSPPTTVSV